MNNSKAIEKTIAHAFALKEKGVAVPTILAVFPDERKYIEAAFSFVGELKTKRDELEPREDAFAQLFEGLSLKRSATVPIKEEDKVVIEKQIKRAERELPREQNSREVVPTPFSFDFIKTKWSFGIMTAVVIVLAYVFLPNLTEKPTSGDSVLGLFASELQDESQTVKDDRDISLARSDSTDIQIFDTSYDTN